MYATFVTNNQPSFHLWWKENFAKYQNIMKMIENIPYDKAFNNIFHEKIESFKYNACIDLTGAIRGT